jgi:hypothetical protein
MYANAYKQGEDKKPEQLSALTSPGFIDSMSERNSTRHTSDNAREARMAEETLRRKFPFHR